MAVAIDFVVRDVTGATQHGAVATDDLGNFIQVGSGDSVSLNLNRESIVSYEQQGSDLVITLIDGRTVVLSNYFEAANHLYLSADGEITEVMVTATGDGVLFADYAPTQHWEKFSPLDDLRFASSDQVSEVMVAQDEPAGMAQFIPGLVGLPGLGLAALGAGVVAVTGGDTPPGGDTLPGFKCKLSEIFSAAW